MAAILGLIILGALVVAAEFGARWYLADRIETETSQRIGAPVDAEIGKKSLLWTLATDRSVESVRVTSPGAGEVPEFDVTAHGARLVNGAVRADSATGTASLTQDQLTAAAASGNPAADSPVAGLTEVRAVRPDAAAGLLRADVGGVAEVGVQPGVSGGALTLTPQETQILGFPLPDGLFSGITGKVESAVDSLPAGVVIDGARVVDRGLEVHLSGTDVSLR